MGVAFTKGFQPSFSWLVGRRCGFLQDKWLYWGASYRCWGFSWSAGGTVVSPNRRARYKTAIRPGAKETSHTFLWDLVGGSQRNHASLHCHSAQGMTCWGHCSGLCLSLWRLSLRSQGILQVKCQHAFLSVDVCLSLPLMQSDFLHWMCKHGTLLPEMTLRQPPMAPDHSSGPKSHFWLVQPSLPLTSTQTRSWTLLALLLFVPSLKKTVSSLMVALPSVHPWQLTQFWAHTMYLVRFGLIHGPSWYDGTQTWLHITSGRV